MKNILNKVFWDKRENPDDYTLTFVHRGGSEDVKKIQLRRIVDVGNSWFAYGDGEEGETMIPFHRVISIKNTKSGEVLWRKMATPH